MSDLWVELRPLAVKVEEARTAVIEVARLAHHQDGTDLGNAVEALDHAERTLGLKTAQLLLGRGPELRFEGYVEQQAGEAGQAADLEDQIERVIGPPTGRPPLPKPVGGAWTKKRGE